MFNASPSKRLKTSILSPAKDNALSSVLSLARATKQLLAAQDAETRQTAAHAVAEACENTDDDNEIASHDAVRPLAEMLRGSDGEAEAGALALWNLARNSTNRVSIAKAGAIPLLVAILQNGTDTAKENAAAALWNLAHDNDNNRVSIAKAGAIALLVTLLQKGTDTAKNNAAGALLNLIVKNENNQVSILKAGAIPWLVALIQNGTDTAQVNAAGALKFLSVNEDNRVSIAKAGEWHRHGERECRGCPLESRL